MWRIRTLSPKAICPTVKARCTTWSAISCMGRMSLLAPRKTEASPEHVLIWNLPRTIFISTELRDPNRPKQWPNSVVNQGEKREKRGNRKHIFRQHQLPRTTETLGNPNYAIQGSQLPHAQQKQHNILLPMDQQSHKKNSRSFLVRLIFQKHYKNPKLWNCFNTSNPKLHFFKYAFLSGVAHL